MSIAARAGAARDTSVIPPRNTLNAWMWRIAIVAVVTTLVVLIFTLDDRIAVGFTSIALMFALMLTRMPVAFVMSIPGLLGIYALSGSIAFANVATGTPMHAIAQWALSVLPMFLLMGTALGYSGLTTTMYTTARNWLAWLPGGLAVGTNMAGMGLAAVSGSTIGTTYALGRVGIPEMFRAGYSKQLAVGSVIVAGLPGQLIPPSISLVVIAGLLELPVGPTLLAGILPGISVGILFSFMIIVFALIFPKWAGRGKDVVKPVITWGDRWRSLGLIWPLVALMVLVFGGMFAGVFTATEAGAAGALGAIILLLVFKRKEKPLKLMVQSGLDTVSTTGAIFLLIVGAFIFSSLIAVSGIGRLLADVVGGAGFDRVGFLFFILLVYLALGTFMDPLPMMLMTIPLILPLLGPLGIDPMWYAVFAVFMGEIAILSPPVGILTFVIHKMVQDPKVGLGNKISVNDVFNTVWLFTPMAALVVVIWIFFPEIVTWLPNQM